jgi:hypothetical protein
MPEILEMITKFGIYILGYTAVIAIAVYIITMRINGKNKELLEIDFDKLPQDQKKLLSKIENLEKKTIVLADKLNSLQTTANLTKEQMDYTTANFNSDLATLV